MSERIETIEDLAKIAGAELGTKQGKAAIEKAAEADFPPTEAKNKPTKTSKPAEVIDIKRTDTVIDPDSKPRNGDIVKGKTVDHLTKMYNAFEVGYIEHYPFARTMLDDMRNEPNPINSHTRTYKKKSLPKLIRKEIERSKKFRKIYEDGIARGENNVGYVCASISVEREVARMEAYLAELTEKA